MRARFVVIALAFALAALRSSGPLPASAASGAPAPAAVVTLTGTRTVTVSGTVRSGPAPGTYAVTETDAGLASRSLAFGPPASTPVSGIQPVTETVHSVVTLTQEDGPMVVSSADTVFGIDRGAHQEYTVNDVRTVTADYQGAGLGAVERVVERGNGTNGVGFAAVDVRRTTNPDGSFDETGSLSTFETHVLHVRADFSADAHDQTPGFGLRDVTTGPPSGLGPGATIPVTLSTQGRTIGPTPVETRTYTVPVWFPAQSLPTLVDHVVTPSARFAAECSAPPALIVLAVRDRRKQIDPTGTITDVVHEVFYTLGYAPLCRIDHTSISYVDVTTGLQTGALSDRTVVSTYRRPHVELVR